MEALNQKEKEVILESVKRFYIENRISKVTFDSIKQKLKG